MRSLWQFAWLVAPRQATRHRLMRLHFAAELVLELVYQRFGRPEKTGADISPSRARLDFAWDGNISSTFPVLEAGVARLVGADLPVVSAYEDEKSQRRYWEVAGFARVPCGGTCVSTTWRTTAFSTAAWRCRLMSS